MAQNCWYCMAQNYWYSTVYTAGPSGGGEEKKRKERKGKEKIK
jgi:hypothetical protein